MKRRMDVWHIISFAILALYALFLILPLGRLLRNSVVGPEGGFSLDNFGFGHRKTFLSAAAPIFVGSTKTPVAQGRARVRGRPQMLVRFRIKTAPVRNRRTDGAKWS